MPRGRRSSVSLARKVSLLFGTAVLLTISVTLAFPWLHMSNLNNEALLTQAKWVASIARQAVDLHQPDWQRAQENLAQRWPLLTRELGLPSPGPALVSVDAGGHGFHGDAIRRFRREPLQPYYWRLQDEGRIFRFAMAVRGTDADAHPNRLRGLIDVRLPVPRAQGVWNSVVTVLAGASGAVLAILVFYLVTQRLVLTPVRSLRRVAEQVTVGDLDVRSSISSGDEFQELSEAFNDMLAHLKQAQEELQRTNRSLDVKIGELAESNVALFESNRVQAGFLANVSHELRTPLVSIIGFAELLRDAWDNPDTDRKRLSRYSENILASGRSLLDIINDLLDVAKIEAGKIELHLSDFSLSRLCRDLIDFVQPLADKRNQQLSLRLAPNMPPFHSDAGRIRQILYNLLSNAIKFTPTGGSVSLTVEVEDATAVRLSVSDTGPGIAEDHQALIFEKFRQLDASKTREFEGTGLGLSITRDLVHILGGTIRIDSVEGSGATFAVILPVTTKKPVAPPPVSLT